MPPLIIQQLQVEGGFLNGLDQPFSPGLNVIIGARGTGKTSLIELIRYALAAKSHTEDSAIRSEDHALGVLQDGIVTVSMTDGFDDVYVTRASEEPEPTSDAPFTPPIVLSQTEIETIGLSETGRLSLIDGFAPSIRKLRENEAVARNSTLAITKEISSLEKEINSLLESLEGRLRLEHELSALKLSQSEMGADSENVELLQRSVEHLTKEEAQAASAEEALSRFGTMLDDQIEDLSNYGTSDADLLLKNSADEDDRIPELSHGYREAMQYLALAQSKLSELTILSKETLLSARSRKLSVQRNLRSVRLELEQLQQGAGSVARQISTTQLALTKLDAIERILRDRLTKLGHHRSQRNAHLKKLAEARQSITDLRTEVTLTLNRSLKPDIMVDVEPQAQRQEYTRSIASALRGSGLKYMDLAALIASRISPTELINFVDEDDFEGISKILGIQKDRGARMLSALRDSDMGSIATALVEDNINMLLLDGVAYKDINALSAGQRCTIVLSIVLQHKDRTLIIDQPEDHLDNAFIANTVIKSLQSRSSSAQLIISTHNANIPVLGNADLVIQLASDGRNGFVASANSLDAEETVKAISNVMEGGRRAFLKRARFYDDHIE